MVLSVPDLTAAANNAGVETFRYFESFVIAAVFYVIAAHIIQALWRVLGASLFPTYVR
jgi:ABC-type amino acid transport system permease subunit